MEFFTRLGYCDLGDLSRITQFIETLPGNIHKLDHLPTGTPCFTNLDLAPGSDLVCTKYHNVNGFYTIKGPALCSMFDNWGDIQNWVESKVGATADQVPLLTFTKNHLYKHRDLKRTATVNMGLWNSTDSSTVFWRGNDIAQSVRYDVGEAILANVDEYHSVILNDSPSFFKPRAILMWTVLASYQDTVKRYVR